MRFPSRLLVLLILASASAWAAPPPDPLAQAKDKEHLLDFDGAIAIYNRLLKQAPNDPKLYALRAEDVWILGEYKKAVADFTRALELDSKPPFALDHADLYNKRGEAKWYGGDPKGAIPDYDRAIARRTTDPFLFSDRGEVKLGLGDCAGANADYTSALSLNKAPESDIFQNRGNARLCLGDSTGALADYRNAAGIEQARNPKAIHVLALTAWAAGVYAGKKAEAEKILSAQLAAANPKQGHIDQEYDAARVMLGRAGIAILAADARALKKHNRDDAEAYDSDVFYFTGLKHIADGDLAAARTEFLKALVLKSPFEDVPEFSRAWLKAIERRARK